MGMNCCMQKPALVSSLLRLSGSITDVLHSAPSKFILLDDSYCNTIDVTYSDYSSNGIQYIILYNTITIKITQFKSLAILTPN